MSNVPVRFDGLSEKQAAFVAAMARGAGPKRAAVEAGYKCELSGYSNLQLPHVVSAVHAEIQRQIRSEAAPAALKVMRRILDDENAPARVRADIGKAFLAMAGHIAPSKKEQGAEKQLSEMTSEELRQWIDANQADIERMERELAERAKPVDATVSAQEEAKSLDFLG